MPTNDFKPFATAGGANVSTQAEYLALAALSTGWQSGKASSKEINKAVRQATFIAAALAQFVSDKGAVDVLDDGNLAGFGTNLIAAMNKTSQPLDATLTALAALVGAANKLPYFNGAETAALTDLTQVGRDIIGKADVAAVLTYLGLDRIQQRTDETWIYGPTKKTYLYITNSSWGAYNSDTGELIPLPLTAGGTGGKTAAEARTNLGLGGSSTLNVGTTANTVAAGNDSRLTNLKSAANRDVGTAANQIPDMSSFPSGPGWYKLPSGDLVQYGSVSGNSQYTINLPVPYVNTSYIVLATPDGGAAVPGDQRSFVETGNISAGQFVATVTNAAAAPQSRLVKWIAIGRMS